MKLFRSKQDAQLDQAISELRGEQPDAKTLSASTERVWQRLQTSADEEAVASAVQPIRGCVDIRSLLPAFHQKELPAARALIVEDHLRECVLCRSYAYGRGPESASSSSWRMEPTSRGFQWSFARVSFAAAMAALLVTLTWTARNWYFAGPPGNRARIVSIEGQAYGIGPAGERALKPGDEVGEGEFIRTTANSHAKVRLYEGSEVEMNQRAEFAVSARRRDTTVHLDQGSIIVQAAKRHTGHLYVSAPDCTVAVTGTVFSVNSGTKGSRVAVIEGEVHVNHAGTESILHSGDVVATTESIGVVPVREEIAWSSDLDHELALLAEFSKFRAKLEEIHTPGPRYESKILPLLPADTVLYIGIPNLGDALQQANQIFQQQLSQSKVLQDWWNKSGNSNQHPTPQELIDQIQVMSRYLGDEVVITARASSIGHGPMLLAEVREPGLKDYLQNHLADSMKSPQGQANLHVVDQQSLSSLAGDERGMIMLVRQNMLVAGGDAASVREMSAQLDAGATLFAETDFGQRIAAIYSRGTETLVAANLGQIINSSHTQQADSKALQNSGFNDIKYLIASRGESSGQGDNRITLEFNGQRRGIASWLAAPAPMGSLDYVSSNAGAAVSFVAKQPALMLDDIFSTIGASDPNFTKSLAQTNSELGLDLRNDLASALGGEMTLALDGPVLPTPSWKAVVEVNDPGALQVAIDKLVQAGNREAQKSNQPGASLGQEQVGGRTFYTIQSQGVGLSTEFDYTFSDGYMIMAPSRGLLLAALQTHANGTSLARSASFRALLPSDNQANFSAMIYQNLSPILKPLASQLTTSQLTILQQLAADSKASVFCAYGESDRIEVASSSKLFGLNPGLPTLIHLLSLSDHGTSRQANP
ncbi:MAG TPA: FecR domain-containing protein [Candidatus Cybelea sp.]|nr:FecR domain-containing protein [Candidatus Cybelea sp.]